MASKSTVPKSTQKSQAPPPSKAPTTLPPTSARSQPTLEDVQKTPGTPIAATELLKLQSTGSLPLGVTLAMHPAMHKVKNGGEEFVVVLVDAPPCGCRKVNGKKERCRQHRAQRRHKKKNKKSKKKDGMVKDDDSDRKKLGALRHAEDSEEEGDQAIAGAFTPDKVVIVGPAGAAISVPLDTADNPNAAARAPENLKEPIKGILVKRPQDCPQFIPEDKIPKDEKGEPKFAKYIHGTLIRNEKGEHVFFPDGGPKWNDKGQGLDMVVEGADPLVEKAVGDKLHVAGFVDVNEAGLPVFRQITPDNPAPQDKQATVGVLAVVNGETVFVQTKGQTVGSGDAAPVIPITKDGPQAPGTLLGEVVIKNGKVEAVPLGQAGGAEQVGMVVQGDFNQPVLVAKKGGKLDQNGTVTYDEAKAKTMKEPDWKALAVAQQDQLKQAAPAIEKNDIAVAAAISGKSPDQIKKEMADAKANPYGGQEVISQCFDQGYQGRSVFAYAANKGGAGGGAGGGAAGGGGEGNYQYVNGEVASNYSAGVSGGGGKSVFMK